MHLCTLSFTFIYMSKELRELSHRVSDSISDALYELATELAKVAEEIPDLENAVDMVAMSWYANIILDNYSFNHHSSFRQNHELKVPYNSRIHFYILSQVVEKYQSIENDRHKSAESLEDKSVVVDLLEQLREVSYLHACVIILQKCHPYNLTVVSLSYTGPYRSINRLKKKSVSISPIV